MNSIFRTLSGLGFPGNRKRIGKKTLAAIRYQVEGVNKSKIKRDESGEPVFDDEFFGKNYFAENYASLEEARMSAGRFEEYVIREVRMYDRGKSILGKVVEKK